MKEINNLMKSTLDKTELEKELNLLKEYLQL